MLISRLEPNTAAETELHRLVLPFLRCTFAYTMSGLRAAGGVVKKSAKKMAKGFSGLWEHHLKNTPAHEWRRPLHFFLLFRA